MKLQTERKRQTGKCSFPVFSTENGSRGFGIFCIHPRRGHHSHRHSHRHSHHFFLLFCSALLTLAGCSEAPDPALSVEVTAGEKRKASGEQERGASGLPEWMKSREKEILKLFSGGESIRMEGIRGGKGYASVLDSKGEKAGYLLYSTSPETTAEGFNGALPMAVALNKEDRVITVFPLENKEDPPYMRKILDESMLLEEWCGFHREEAEGLEVDTVSGATYSSRGIIESVRLLLGKDVPEKSQMN